MSVPEILSTPDLVDPAELTLYPGNPRHGDVEAIADSIRANGFYSPLIVQRSTGHVLAGNHRLQAAVELGLTAVPVHYIEVNDVEAKRILIADNATSDKGVNDDMALARIVAEVQAASEDTTGFGLDEEEVGNYLAIARHADREAERLAAVEEGNPFEWRGAAPEVAGQEQKPIATKGAPVPGDEKAKEPATGPAPAKTEANTARRIFILDLPLNAYAWLSDRIEEMLEDHDLDAPAQAVLLAVAEATGTDAPRLTKADLRVSDPVADGVPATG